MRFLIFVAVIGVTFGSLFLFAPDIVRDMNDRWNRMIYVCDEKIMKHRKPVGVILLIIGLYTFFVVYRLFSEYGMELM